MCLFLLCFKVKTITMLPLRHSKLDKHVIVFKKGIFYVIFLWSCKHVFFQHWFFVQFYYSKCSEKIFITNTNTPCFISFNIENKVV